MKDKLIQPPSFESPISVIVPAGATQTISFPQTFFGFGTAIIITNLDPSAVATYQINGASQPTLTLLGGDFRTLNGIKIDLITVTAAIGGAFQIQAIRLPLRK